MSIEIPSALLNQEDWWRGAVIYQIYPRSFLDTNGDGIGDLPGIIEKLDYVADLGVDGVWISPFFKSPMKDFGYDISDYREIDPLFGTMDDFDALLEKAHNLGLKVIIDLVLSHTSDQHPWFSDPEKKNWYVWADAKTDDKGNRQPPNNWVSVFGGGAWEWDDRYQQYYFHNFLKEQPDLNFHNPDVRAALLDTCKFWLDKGVDGFRLDVVNFYVHDPLLRDNPPNTDDESYATQFEEKTPYSCQQHVYDKSRPENIWFLQALRALTDQYSGRVLIGEIGDDHPYKLAQNYTSGGDKLHTTYNPHMMSGTEKELTADFIREPIEYFFENHARVCADSPDNKHLGWPSWAFSNHDVVRAASRWYHLYEYEPAFSRLLIALLACLPGTLFLYQGEELGLPEAEIPYDRLQDPWAKETWPEWQGRDGCRTPMVWDNTQSRAGFSTAQLWLPIPASHDSLSVRQQEHDKLSALNFTKCILSWRKEHRHILRGTFEFIDTNNSKIIHIIRKNNNNETNCIFNLSDEEVVYSQKTLQPFSAHIDGFSFS